MLNDWLFACDFILSQAQRSFLHHVGKVCHSVSLPICNTWIGSDIYEESASDIPYPPAEVMLQVKTLGFHLSSDRRRL